MIDYTPPTPADMQSLKDALGYTGEEMAELLDVSGGQQWRKYTNPSGTTQLPMRALFFIAARLTLSSEALKLVGYKMREIGAQIDPSDLSGLKK